VADPCPSVQFARRSSSLVDRLGSRSNRSKLIITGRIIASDTWNATTIAHTAYLHQPCTCTLCVGRLSLHLLPPSNRLAHQICAAYRAYHGSGLAHVRSSPVPYMRRRSSFRWILTVETSFAGTHSSQWMDGVLVFSKLVSLMRVLIAAQAAMFYIAFCLVSIADLSGSVIVSV